MLYLETEKCNRIERKKLKNMEHILQITVHPQIKFIKVSEDGLMNAFTTAFNPSPNIGKEERRAAAANIQQAPVSKIL